MNLELAQGALGVPRPIPWRASNGFTVSSRGDRVTGGQHVTRTSVSGNNESSLTG